MVTSSRGVAAGMDYAAEPAEDLLWAMTGGFRWNRAMTFIKSAGSSFRSCCFEISVAADDDGSLIGR